MKQGRHVLITGATGGIGAALADRLANTGFDLTLVARDPVRLASLGSQLKRHGAKIEEIPIALGADTNYDSILQRAEASNGPVDILVNNAAINWFGHFATMPSTDIGELVETNLTVPIRMARAALVGMQKRRSGSVVNIGSVFGSIGFPGFSVYSSCKFALRGFSEALRRELAGSGVSVIYIAPRYTRTAFNRGIIADMACATGMTMDEPDAVARQIEMAIFRRRPETFIGWPERFFAKLNACLPKLVDFGLSSKTGEILAFAPGEFTGVKSTMENN